MAGSVASQAFNIAVGTQNSFSWKSVATAAVSGSVGNAIGGGLRPESWTSAAVRGAVSSTISQGISVATGLQSAFSWRSVAASAAGSGVGFAVAQNVDSSPFAKGFASSLAAGTTASILRGGRVSVVQVAADAFGNALGSSLARQSAASDIERKLQAAGEYLKTSERFVSLADDPRDSASAISQVHIKASKLTWYEKAWSYVAEAGESVGNFFSRAFDFGTSSGQNPVPNYDFTNAVAAARIRKSEQARPVQPIIWDPRSARLNSWDQQVARGLHAPFDMAMQSATDVGAGSRAIKEGNTLSGALQLGGGLLGTASLVPFGRALGGMGGATLSRNPTTSFGTPVWNVAKNGAYSQKFGAGALEANFGLSTGYSSGSTRLFGTQSNGVNGAGRTTTYTGDVYAADFVGPVEWKYFYRGDATARTEFLSSMARERGMAATTEFLNSRSTGQLDDIFAEHGIGSQGQPTIGVSQNKQVAEYFARGPGQNQKGFVTTFRLESRDAATFARANYENPMSFFEVNPYIGVPEQEFLFAPSIPKKFIFNQVPVGLK